MLFLTHYLKMYNFLHFRGLVSHHEWQREDALLLTKEPAKRRCCTWTEKHFTFYLKLSFRGFTVSLLRQLGWVMGNVYSHTDTKCFFLKGTFYISLWTSLLQSIWNICFSYVNVVMYLCACNKIFFVILFLNVNFLKNALKWHQCFKRK